MTRQGPDMDGHDPLRLDHQLCFPLYAATNLIQRLYRPLLAPLGLTYSQYLVMLILWERGSATVGELRDCLHLDSGTITPLLKRMERGGFVLRERDSQDERRVIVTPTDHAVAMREQAATIPATLAARMEIDLDDGAQLYIATTALVSHLKGLVSANADQPDMLSTKGE